ncbi:hypothetical protein FIBSPDRAFT_900373 [Athelia psychrophila]|uniref:Uncharacterized protein n=1 Tax=Athelia psychrophila TaxID=1759441 RepID=A0A165YJE8_9AGAM|nr:hypothetical protein FIBSPDRAFT_900373 [Fibularhizoctonia sp. CBS 109695]
MCYRVWRGRELARDWELVRVQGTGTGPGTGCGHVGAELVHMCGVWVCMVVEWAPGAGAGCAGLGLELPRAHVCGTGGELVGSWSGHRERAQAWAQGMHWCTDLGAWGWVWTCGLGMRGELEQVRARALGARTGAGTGAGTSTDVGSWCTGVGVGVGANRSEELVIGGGGESVEGAVVVVRR